MSEDLGFPVVLVILAATSLLLLATRLVIRAAAEGRMPRKSVAGIRTRATKVSDAAWRAGHAAALPVMRTQSALLIALAVLFAAAAAYLAIRQILVPEWWAWPAIGAWFAATLLPLGRAVQLADRAVKRVVG